MASLEREELANQIRREWEFRGYPPPVGSYDNFEIQLAGFHRRYLEEMLVFVASRIEVVHGQF